MLFTKPSTTGLDTPIQAYQSFLYNQLKALWNLSEETFEAYGRCYRNQVDRGYTPEVFVSSAAENNTKYKELDFDETTLSALFFFDVWDSIKQDAGTSKAKADLIFIVNVAKVKPNLQHRGDEEIRNEVGRTCLPARFGFRMTETVTGFKNVFQRFEALLTSEQVTFMDLHPLHVFKIGFDLVYNIANQC